MTWRDAFLAQARSDAGVRRVLNHQQVAYSHQLHYLQMMTEKISKAVLTPAGSVEPPRPSHVQFVRCLRLLRNMPQIRRMLGYEHAESYRAMIDSFLPLARQIEQLAPSEAGFTQPNPEYPWRSLADQTILVPAEFDFPAFNAMNTRLGLLVDFIERLMRIPL